MSAFAPICNPMNVPWGQKAFKFYLGEDTQAWLASRKIHCFKRAYPKVRSLGSAIRLNRPQQSLIGA